MINQLLPTCLAVATRAMPVTMNRKNENKNRMHENEDVYPYPLLVEPTYEVRLSPTRALSFGFMQEVRRAEIARRSASDTIGSCAKDQISIKRL